MALLLVALVVDLVVGSVRLFDRGAVVVMGSLRLRGR